MMGYKLIKRRKLVNLLLWPRYSMFLSFLKCPFIFEMSKDWRVREHSSENWWVLWNLSYLNLWHHCFKWAWEHLVEQISFRLGPMAGRLIRLTLSRTIISPLGKLHFQMHDRRLNKLGVIQILRHPIFLNFLPPSLFLLPTLRLEIIPK